MQNQDSAELHDCPLCGSAMVPVEITQKNKWKKGIKKGDIHFWCDACSKFEGVTQTEADKGLVDRKEARMHACLVRWGSTYLNRPREPGIEPPE